MMMTIQLLSSRAAMTPERMRNMMWVLSRKGASATRIPLSVIYLPKMQKMNHCWVTVVTTWQMLKAFALESRRIQKPAPIPKPRMKHTTAWIKWQQSMPTYCQTLTGQAWGWVSSCPTLKRGVATTEMEGTKLILIGIKTHCQKAYSRIYLPDLSRNPTCSAPSSSTGRAAKCVGRCSLVPAGFGAGSAAQPTTRWSN